MNQRSYNSITGFIFLAITVIHLLRAFNGWTARIDTLIIPMWASWVAVLVGGYLTSQAFKKR